MSSLAGALPHLIEIALLAVTAAAGWLATRAARWLRLQNEEALRRPLVDLVETMAQAVRVRMGGAAITPELAEGLVPRLAEHVARSYPDRLRALAVSREAVEDMLRVRIGHSPGPRG
jgi:hypothetical protein